MREIRQISKNGMVSYESFSNIFVKKITKERSENYIIENYNGLTLDVKEKKWCINTGKYIGNVERISIYQKYMTYILNLIQMPEINFSWDLDKVDEFHLIENIISDNIKINDINNDYKPKIIELIRDQKLKMILE